MTGSTTPIGNICIALGLHFLVDNLTSYLQNWVSYRPTEISKFLKSTSAGGLRTVGLTFLVLLYIIHIYLVGSVQLCLLSLCARCRGFIKSRLHCLSLPVTKLHIQESSSCNIKYRNGQKQLWVFVLHTLIRSCTAAYLLPMAVC